MILDGISFCFAFFLLAYLRYNCKIEDIVEFYSSFTLQEKKKKSGKIDKAKPNRNRRNTRNCCVRLLMFRWSSLKLIKIRCSVGAFSIESIWHPITEFFENIFTFHFMVMVNALKCRVFHLNYRNRCARNRNRNRDESALKAALKFNFVCKVFRVTFSTGLSQLARSSNAH